MVSLDHLKRKFSYNLVFKITSNTVAIFSSSYDLFVINLE